MAGTSAPAHARLRRSSPGQTSRSRCQRTLEKPAARSCVRVRLSSQLTRSDIAAISRRARSAANVRLRQDGGWSSRCPSVRPRPLASRAHSDLVMPSRDVVQPATRGPSALSAPDTREAAAIDGARRTRCRLRMDVRARPEIFREETERTIGTFSCFSLFENDV